MTLIYVRKQRKGETYMCNLYEPNCEFFRRRFVEQNKELSRWTYCTGRNIRPTKFVSNQMKLSNYKDL